MLKTKAKTLSFFDKNKGQLVGDAVDFSKYFESPIASVLTYGMTQKGKKEGSGTHKLINIAIDENANGIIQ